MWTPHAVWPLPPHPQPSHSSVLRRTFPPTFTAALHPRGHPTGGCSTLHSADSPQPGPWRLGDSPHIPHSAVGGGQDPILTLPWVLPRHRRGWWCVSGSLPRCTFLGAQLHPWDGERTGETCLMTHLGRDAGSSRSGLGVLEPAGPEAGGPWCCPGRMAMAPGTGNVLRLQ